MPSSPLKVLLIEDDEDDYVIARDLFAEIKRQKYELTWVNTYEKGQEALACGDYDVCLVDCRLAGRNGLELLREAVRQGCASPIIVLTGIGDEKVDIEAINLGAADYLVKGQISAALLERSVNHAVQRKKIEQQLRDSEEQYRLLFEKNPHPMWVVDSESFVFLAANEAAIQHYGFSIEEFSGMTIKDLRAPTPMEDKTKSPIAQSTTPGTEAGLSGISRHRKKNGAAIDVEVTSNQISFHGRPATLVLANDITQRLALEAQLRQSQKMESLGTLAGGIAHDFNNILCIILGYTSGLPGIRNETERFQKSVFSIEKAVDRGTGLVKQILTFARRTEVSVEPININALAEELVRMLEGTFPKTISFYLNLAREIPLITGDSSRLHQSLLNLCVNARDAMPGGGTLSIRTGIVREVDRRGVFPEMQPGDYVSIEVEDSGSGMDETTRSRIFEPFFTTKSREGGSGLGLAVVYGVIKSHQGFIQVESELGRGTTFRIYLPVPQCAGADLSERPKTSDESPEGTETILVVEDEESLRDLMVELLAGRGYNVLTAKDGLKAVEVYSQHSREIALVITDFGLPKLGGYETLLKMKEINPAVKAIFASGYLDPDLKNKMLDAGACDFIQKPYVLTEICRRVRIALGGTVR